MKLAFSVIVAFAALCILYVNTEGRTYTYAQEAEKWAIETCGDSGVKELRFHGNRQITLKCGDKGTYFLDGSTLKKRNPPKSDH